VGLMVALPVSFALCRNAMGGMHSQMFSLLRALSAP
jgi:hypothetical protein